MAAHVRDATFEFPFRRLVFPTAFWSAVAAAALLLTRYARQPSVAPMSDDWLRSHSRDRTPAD